MNSNLHKLQVYPFEKLRHLLAEETPAANKAEIRLTIGEPQHAPPKPVVDSLVAHLEGIGRYPMAKGLPELRETVANWANRRYQLTRDLLDPETHILPVAGTREALFAFVQAIFDTEDSRRKVLMPNPFYQIYEGGALLAGAEVAYINCTEKNGYQPGFNTIPEALWAQTQILFICSPGNPTGVVMSEDDYRLVLEKSAQHDFIIASDECYSELYTEESSPPLGLLRAAEQFGLREFSRCVLFNSLSKRSNVPGLRSGFVAGDADVIANFLQYRNYHGCAMPLFAQQASITAWNDETHVRENRALYREKFSAVLPLLEDITDIRTPEAGFFFWLKIRGDDVEFTRRLYVEENVVVLPGSYLARDTDSGNPGKGHIRVAMVAPIDTCIEACTRLRKFIVRQQH